MDQTYFRRGLGMKQEVAGTLAADYHSRLLDHIKENNFELHVPPLTFRLAKEFGFCYGVDRAVDYAYQARSKFPGKRIYLVGEIIHNPHVNAKLSKMEVEILETGADGKVDFSHVSQDDVVIIPAFGVPTGDLAWLKERGCVLVDTTCGSVLNVWKRVDQYARDGFTALIHGKYYHEESQATASQVTRYDNGHYIIVRDMEEAEEVCTFIEQSGDPVALGERFAKAVSPGFSAEHHLLRIGVANQTTMLANESLEIAARVGRAMIARYGADALPEHFRSFDTICSATQERQDAIIELIEKAPDAMVVIGGYNSSNTNNLARICETRTTTYHVADASCIDPETGVIRHKPADRDDEVQSANWLSDDVKTIGITAGASTPNNKIGEAIELMCATRGLEITV